MEGHVLIWEVTNADTAIAGSGTVELMGLADGKKKLSAITKTYIRATTTGATTEPPDSARPWVDQVLEAAERAEAAAERAESAGGSGGSAGGIVTETDPTVYDWAKQPQKPTYTADEVNAIDKDELPQAIDAALDQAKLSGAFDGPKGEPGDSGVHIGPDEPTNPDVKVWINPKGEGKYIDETLTQAGKAADARATGEAIDKIYEEKADKADIPEPYTLPVATADKLGGVKVGKGLRMDGEALGVEPEGEYELIETIVIGYTLLAEQPEDWETNWSAYYEIKSDTISALTAKKEFEPYTFYMADGTEAVDSIKRTAEPDGTPWNFSRILIKNDCIAAAANGTFNVSFSNAVSVSTTNMVATNRRYSYCRAWTECKSLRAVASSAAATMYSNTNQYEGGYYYVGNRRSVIESVSFSRSGDTTGRIMAGSKFEIWGVRKK